MKIKNLLLGLVALSVLSACNPDPSSQPSQPSGEIPSQSSEVPSSSEWIPPTPVWEPAKTISFTPMAEYSGNYWDSIDFNKRGNELKDDLLNYLHPKKKLITYGQTMDALREMDRDPNNSNNVLSIYDLKSHAGAGYNGGKWNKEHAFPQSKLKINSSEAGATNNKADIFSDVANLFASDADLNTERSNNSFGEWNYASDPELFYDFTTINTAKQHTDSLLRRGYFSPTPLVRGEIARSQFYMLVMYPERCEIQENFLIHTMIKWDQEWAPTVERDGQRQTGIEKYQNIRNPFIDNRNLSCYIWGDYSMQTRDLCAGIY